MTLAFTGIVWLTVSDTGPLLWSREMLTFRFTQGGGPGGERTMELCLGKR